MRVFATQLYCLQLTIQDNKRNGTELGNEHRSFYTENNTRGGLHIMLLKIAQEKEKPDVSLSMP